MINDTKLDSLSYIGGFIDGEGCIGTQSSKGFIYPHLTITQRDPEILRWIQKELGGTGCMWFDSKGGTNGVWRLKWSSKQCQTVLRLIVPYLKGKKEEAELAVTMREVSPEERLVIKGRLASLKGRL